MNYNLSEYKFKELVTWMDGGSITLYFKSNKNEELAIDLQQFIINEYYEGISKIPGRIYLNGKMIDKRSLTEELILEFLNCNVLNKVTGLEKEILIKQIHWIESKDYIEHNPIKLELSESRKKELGIKTE